MSTRCLLRLFSPLCFLVSSLPHASSSETKMWKRVGVVFFACNLSRRVRSRQLNSVSWMLLQCSLRRWRPVPTERRGDETHTRTNNSTKPPYRTAWGMNALVSQVRVQKTGMYKPRSYNPRHPLLITLATRITIQ